MAYERQFKVTGKVISSGLGSASTGTEQVCVLFGYKHPDGDERTINWYGYFSSDKSTEIADEALTNLGWNPAENAYAYNSLNGDDSPLVGKTAQLVLDYEDDRDGQERLKVKFVNRGGGGLGLKERMSPEDAAAFAAKRRAMAGGAPVASARPKPAQPPAKQENAFRNPTPEQRAAATRPAGADAEFDDIPF